jgi:uncharacterized membrane protein YgdD (TMEM256/DUF423 family)
MSLAERLLAFFGAVLAGAGVALAAYAAHANGDEKLHTASLFMSLHGVGMVAITAYGWSGKTRALGLGALLLGLGTALFAADLVSLTLQGHALFPYAAPIGGTSMILAWLGIALAFLAG